MQIRHSVVIDDVGGDNHIHLFPPVCACVFFVWRVGEGEASECVGEVGKRLVVMAGIIRANAS